MTSEPFQDLPTPCLIVDRAKLTHNIQRMKSRMAGLGVSLRPHVKTCKSVEIIRMLFDGGIGPITVSTLREAEYFFDGGFRDILYAVGIVPQKLPRIQRLIERGATMTLILDSMEVAEALINYATQHQVTLHVVIEIDSDMHRSGLSPDDPLILDIARRVTASERVSFMGFMTHAGESYNCQTTKDIQHFSHMERDAVLDAAKYVGEIGITCPMISVGSTPTASFADDLSGITEVRAGVFIFQDMVMENLGVCSMDDLALTVLATVIGHKKNQNRIIIDAGGLALSKDRGTASQKIDRLYGLVCKADSGALIPELIVEATNQEHGLITNPTNEVNFDAYPIGSQLRILPNHACMTAAAHSHYYLTDGDQKVSDIWQRCQGW